MDPARKKSVELHQIPGTDEERLFGFRKADVISEAESEAVESDSSITNFRILVVEDFPLNQLLMKTLLEDFGCNCTIAPNGKVAIDILEKGYYDLIFMDLQIPEMNGFEVTKYIRKKMKLKVPIVALTADITSVDLTLCKTIGMNDYIPKPIDSDLIRDKIIELVKKYSIRYNNTDNTHTLTHIKYCNLASITERTKSKPELMTEMILLYLEQIPILVKVINESLIARNWKLMNAAAHKLIPSFAIMGIHKDYENLARKIEEFTGADKQINKLPELVSQLECICSKACQELKEAVKKKVHDK